MSHTGFSLHNFSPKISTVCDSLDAVVMRTVRLVYVSLVSFFVSLHKTEITTMI